jgi:hypothetical protein
VGAPPPGFFVSVAATGFADEIATSVDTREVASGRIRLKHGETRCFFASVDFDGDRKRQVNEV